MDSFAGMPICPYPTISQHVFSKFYDLLTSSGYIIYISYIPIGPIVIRILAE